MQQRRGQEQAPVVMPPDRPDSAPDPVYAATSAFASCPAATGPYDHGVRCDTYPDGAHRCKHPRQSHTEHACTDGFRWYTTGSPRAGRFRGETK